MNRTHHPWDRHSQARWIKSSYSGNNGTCVEVANVTDGVAVRDSKDTDKPHFAVPKSSWRSFAHWAAIKHC